MSYIESNLIPGEEVLILSKPSKYDRNGAFVVGFVALFSSLASPGFGIFLGSLAAILYVRWANTEYAVTNQRVISKTGTFSVNLQEINIKKVESASMSKSFFTGCGDVVIKGTGGYQVLFKNVDDPKKIRDVLFGEIEKNSSK